jgi:hypothetical protein
VLIGAGDKQHGVTGQTVVAGEHIGGHGGVGVAEVRDIVDVIDGGGDKKGAGHG